MVARLASFPTRAMPSRTSAVSCLVLLAGVVLASGCVGDSHAHDAPLVHFRVVQDASGLRFELSSPAAFPSDATITIKAVGASVASIDDSFEADELLPGPNGTFGVPATY